VTGTEAPTADPDVLVVGGGIAGLFCAYFLRQAGHSVTVLEQARIGDPVACSSGNTGFVGLGGVPLAGPGILAEGLRSLLRPDDRLALPPTLDLDRLRWIAQLRRAGGPEQVRRAAAGMLELKRRSLDILGELPASAGFRATGMLQAYKSPAGFDQARRAAETATAAGIGLRALGPDELRELEPDCEFDIAGALHHDGGGFLPAPEFAVAFSRLLTELGVRLLEHTTVQGFEVAGNSVRLVRTSAGQLRPAELVLAAGSWTRALAGRLELDLALQPIRGYAVTLDRPANGPRLPVILVEGTVAVRPLGDRLRFAGDLTLAGAHRSIARRRVNRLWRTVTEHLPAMTLTGPSQVWTGLRPCTPDSLPLLGRVAGWRNLSVAAGHGHNGMGLAPAAGQLLAQLVDGKPTSMDAEQFRVDRFRPALTRRGRR
jgi:D-amino-acid dehydrogenase